MTSPDHPAEAPVPLPGVMELDDLRQEHRNIPAKTTTARFFCKKCGEKMPCSTLKLIDAYEAQAGRLARAIEERDTERLAFATAKRAYALDGERLAAEAAEQRGRAERAVETGQAILEAFHINVPGHAGRWSTCPSRLCVNYRRALAALAPPEPAS